jgi:formate hydrogenlyase transcriptional activator
MPINPHSISEHVTLIGLPGENVSSPDITTNSPAGAAQRQVEPSGPQTTLFRQLFEASPDALVVTGSGGLIHETNGQFERLFGYHRGEVVGQNVSLLMPERFRGAHAEHLRNYFAAPRLRPMGVGLELYARRKDGTEFPVDIMLNALHIGPEPVVLAVVRDISERKSLEDERRRVQEALELSEQRLRAMVESVKDYAIFTMDPRGYVMSWNPGAERIKGYRAEEIVGQHFSKFYPQEDLDRGKPDYELKVAAAGGRFEDEGWRLRKDGSRFWANVIISTLRDSAGNLRGFSKVTRDFTERKQAEEALLLQVTNTLISNLDISRLLAAISASIRQVASYDYCGLALFDSSSGQLRTHVLEAPSGRKVPPDGTPIELAGSPAGRAFTSREPVVLNHVEEEGDGFSPADLKRLADLGVHSACWIPLINRGRALGILMVGKIAEVPFTEKDVRLLSHVGGQIAIAVDNAETYRQVTEARERLQEEKAYLEEELRTEYDFEEIVGESHALRRVLKQVETVAPTDATVLILGETGTGKELIARAIHSLSGRRERTFVKLNCAAIPSGLLESELFGHERGAFTGAITQKIGRLELAHRGTLFLDEVGDIPLELQPKLLRALQEKEFERLGSTRTIPVDVRLIAATNRDLAAMVQAREFRSDLFYRLKVFPIEVPPLRVRADDIPILVHHFVAKHARRMNRVIETIPAETMLALQRWSWPGNVRELENLLERAVILSRGPVLRVPLSELTSPEASEPAAGPAVFSSLEATEREHILKVLRDTHGVIAGAEGAAARLGLKRTTLNSKMRKLGISRHDI